MKPIEPGCRCLITRKPQGIELPRHECTVKHLQHEARDKSCHYCGKLDRRWLTDIPVEECKFPNHKGFKYVGFIRACECALVRLDGYEPTVRDVADKAVREYIQRKEEATP